MEAPTQTNQRPGSSSANPQGVAREAASAVREQAAAVADETKASARSMLGEQQQSVAGGLGEFAGALRRAARDTQGGQGSRLAESAAEGLQRFSENLRNKDFDSLVRDAETFARRQPVVFMGAAALAGFLAVRFLKSSRSDSPSQIP